MLYPQFFKKISLFIQKSKYAIIMLVCFLFFEKARAAVSIEVINPLGETKTIEELLQKVINYFLGLVGVIALFVLIFAGFRYLTAGSSDKRAGDAKTMIKWALIGIVVILAAAGIVNTVIEALK